MEENQSLTIWGPEELVPGQLVMVPLACSLTRTNRLTARQFLYLATVCLFMPPMGWFSLINPMRWLGFWMLFWAVNYIKPDAGHTEAEPYKYAGAHIFACLFLGMTWQGTTICTTMIGMFELACMFMPILQTFEFVLFFCSNSAITSDSPSEKCMKTYGWVLSIDENKTLPQQRKEWDTKRKNFWNRFWDFLGMQ